MCHASLIFIFFCFGLLTNTLATIWQPSPNADGQATLAFSLYKSYCLCVTFIKR